MNVHIPLCGVVQLGLSKAAECVLKTCVGCGGDGQTTSGWQRMEGTGLKVLAGRGLLLAAPQMCARGWQRSAAHTRPASGSGCSGGHGRGEEGDPGHLPCGVPLSSTGCRMDLRPCSWHGAYWGFPRTSPRRNPQKAPAAPWDTVPAPTTSPGAARLGPARLGSPREGSHRSRSPVDPWVRVRRAARCASRPRGECLWQAAAR